MIWSPGGGLHPQEVHLENTAKLPMSPDSSLQACYPAELCFRVSWVSTAVREVLLRQMCIENIKYHSQANLNVSQKVFNLVCSM